MTPRRQLWIVLLVTLGVAVFGFGGVHHGTRAVVHGGLALACAVGGVRGPDRSGSPEGAARLLAAMVLVLLAQSVSGGMAVVREGVTRVEPGLVAACQTLAFGTVAALAAWAIPGSRMRRLQVVWMAMGGLLLVVGALHALLGLDALFGVVSPAHAPARFFAPFVNPNHFAICLLWFLPVALATSTGHGPGDRRLGAAALGLGIVGTVVWVGAAAPLACLLVVVALWALQRSVWRWALGLVLAPALLSGVVAWGSASGSDVFASGKGRVDLWLATLDAWRDHLWLGTGPGAFGVDVQPYLRRIVFLGYDHTHNDLLQWGVANGLLGVVLGLAAVALGFPWRALVSPSWRRWGAGLFAVALFSVVDFPFQIPGIALLGAVVIGLGHARSRRGTPRVALGVRALLGLLTVVHLGAALVQVHARAVGQARQRLAVLDDDAQARATLERWAPWGPDVPLADLRKRLRTRAVDASDVAVVQGLVEAHGPTHAIVRTGIPVLLEAGDADAAVALADQAIATVGWDPRVWRLRAMAHQAAHPDEAIPAWVDAVRAGVPDAFWVGWQRMPEGLYWVQAVEGAKPQVRLRVAKELLAKGELWPARLLLEGLQGDTKDAKVLLTRCLQRLQDHEAVVAHLQTATDTPSIAARARALERLGRWAEARDSWMTSWHAGGRGLGLAAQAEARRADDAAAGIRWMEAQTTLGRRPSADDALELASLYHQAGDARRCRQILRTEGADAHDVERRREVEADCASP